MKSSRPAFASNTTQTLIAKGAATGNAPRVVCILTTWAIGAPAPEQAVRKSMKKAKASQTKCSHHRTRDFHRTGQAECSMRCRTTHPTPKTTRMRTRRLLDTTAQLPGQASLPSPTPSRTRALLQSIATRQPSNKHRTLSVLAQEEDPVSATHTLRNSLTHPTI